MRPLSRVEASGAARGAARPPAGRSRSCGAHRAGRVATLGARAAGWSPAPGGAVDEPVKQRRRFVELVERRWVGLLLTLLVVAVVVQNTERTTIRVLGASVEAPLWVVLLVVFVVGAAAGSVRTRRHRER